MGCGLILSLVLFALTVIFIRAEIIDSIVIKRDIFPEESALVADDSVGRKSKTRHSIGCADVGRNVTQGKSIVDFDQLLGNGVKFFFEKKQNVTVQPGCSLIPQHRFVELPYSGTPISISQLRFLISIVIGTLLLLILLWSCIFVYDRKVLRPLLLSVQHVFDSEKLYRLMVDSAPGGLCLLAEDDSKVLLQNHEMHMYHNEATPLAPRFLGIGRLVKADDLTCTQPLGEHDLIAIDRDGKSHHLMVNILRTRHVGRPLLLCIFVEITARKLMEKKLLDARNAADTANAKKSTILANVSHEIRTPLNGIVGNLELLSHTAMTKLQHDRLNIIVNSSRALFDIINDILDFSKIEAGRMSLELISFDLAETVEQAILLFAPLSEKKGLELFYYIHPLLPRYYIGDPIRLRQVVLNLLSNAVKFTKRGSISVVLMIENGDVVLRVVDTGIGISLVRQRELFQPYVQADLSVSRLFGGTGLGLALCDRLIDLMNGKIAISSQEGKGTTVTAKMSLRTDALRPALLPPLSGESMRKVTVVCTTPEWREQLVAVMCAWGIVPMMITHPNELTLVGVPLLLFGRQRHWDLIDEERAGLLAGCIIDVLQDGPRRPIVHPGRIARIVVSCYSTTGLHEAIRRALDTAILIPVTSELAIQVGSTDEPRPLITPSVRVLAVEDHPFNLALVGDQLSLLGYKVTLAASVVDALQLFRPGDFDIILTDLNMPELDGYMLAKILRQQNVLLPIIALTAHAMVEKHARCEQAGINDILVKPVSLNRLDCMIRKHLTGTILPLPDTIFFKHELKLTKEKISVLQLSSMTSLKLIFSGFTNNQAQTMQEQLHSLAGAFAVCGELSIVNTCRALKSECILPLSADLRSRLDILQNDIVEAITRLAAGSGSFIVVL